MAKHYQTLHPVKYYRDFLNHGVRPDGRVLSKFRPVAIDMGSIGTADGSALARIGKTTVVCGIKAELCEPKPERPNEGFLVPNVELPPLCSQKFRPGPPSETAQVATRFIADVLENSKCIDLRDLCICNEKLAWCLYVDLICLDLDGCLIDTCLLALMSALKSVKLPSVEYDAEVDVKIVSTAETKKLKVYNTPVSTTYAIFDNHLLTDPTSEEETYSSGLVTIVVKEDQLCSVHKPGGIPLNEENLFTCIEETTVHGNLLRTLIDTAVDSESD